MGEVARAPNIHHQPSHREVHSGKTVFPAQGESPFLHILVPVNVLVPCTTPSLKSRSGIFLGGVFKDALSSELLCRYCAQKLLTWKIDYRNKDVVK